MNRSWNNIVYPIIISLKPKNLVEIGSDTGINTLLILDYCVNNSGHLTSIDPFPSFDVDAVSKKYGKHFDMVQDLSLNVLSSITDCDFIFLDGDHNWYTVYNELKTIEKNFNQESFPFIIFHDISWPYARRDLYYNPDDIPNEFLNDYAKKGIYPGKVKLVDEGGFNSNLYNAMYDNIPKNGVLTAIEDFLNETHLNLTFKTINSFRGLGFLFPKNPKIDEMIDHVFLNSNITGVMEEQYTKQIIDLQDNLSIKEAKIKSLKSKNKQLSQDNREIQNKLDQEKDKCEKLIIENKKLSKKQEELLSSKSWKITKPLRNLKK